ncbi:reverse transcriptase domain-containing protein [Tanacetum coccineum]
MIDCDVKGVTTRGGKTTTQDVHDNNANLLPKEPVVVEREKLAESNEVLTNDQPQITSKPVVQPSNELSSKEKDPGSFTIPYDISQLHIDNALADLRASISLMPYTMYKKLGLGEPKATRMSLELMQVLERRKGAIAWKMSDIKGISPSYCTHKILMEDDYKPIIQRQRRLNSKVQDVVKNKIMKFLDSGLIYPISDSSWVSPIHVMPKKGGMTVVLNDNNQIIPSRIVIGWRVCIDYHKLNDATRKDHFPLPFIDQMLERLCKNEYYCFLDGFSEFFQIPIAPKDQEKTTFTCPYGTFAYRRMPFGLCNAPATFQRCMTAIFHDMVEDFIEVFMDDFSVFGNSVDCCIANLDRMLARCEETNLVLNWEKCYFMVKEGIVLGHKISRAGIKVDRAKIDVISKLPYPTSVKGIRNFLGHAGFYRRFIKDFSMISKPMTQLLMKDVKFDFSDDCKKAFNILKEKLTTAPIIISLDWNKPFELMYDARAINLAADHLSRLKYPDLGTFTEEEITDEFLDEHLMKLKSELNNDEPWYADYINYIVGKIIPPNWTSKKRRIFFSQVNYYFWDEPYTFKLCSDNVIRRCVAGNEIFEILAHCHSGPTRGHHSASIIRRKVYESGFYWPSIFKDAKDYVMKFDACQRSGNISSRSEMPQNNIQVCDVFDIWGLDFMGPFPNSKGNKYILVAVDYVSKWVKAQALYINDARVVIRFLRRLFTRFRVPKALISDQEMHFCNSQLEKALQKYGVTHKLSTVYHPQTNGQIEMTIRAIKRILERSVEYNLKNWSEKLDDTLWAFRTAYKTPTGCTPFRLVYEKVCHLPVEIEHKAYWALKQCNMDLIAAAKNCFMELNELMVLRDEAYENTRIYKERTKKWHDSRLRGDKNFKAGDKVLIFNSRFKMHPGKLKSKWYGPCVVKTIHPYGTMEIFDKKGVSFKVNGHRLKKYHDGYNNEEEKEVIGLNNEAT